LAGLRLAGRWPLKLVGGVEPAVGDAGALIARMKVAADLGSQRAADGGFAKGYQPLILTDETRITQIRV